MEVIENEKKYSKVPAIGIGFAIFINIGPNAIVGISGRA